MMSQNLLFYFRAEASEILQELSDDIIAFEKAPEAEILSRMLRQAHTLKGAARVAKQRKIADCIHQFEDLLSVHRDAPENCTSDDINKALQLLDIMTSALNELENESSEEPPSGRAKDSVKSAPSPLADVDLAAPQMLLSSRQALEVEGLLEDLQAASGQLESLKRNLQLVERGKDLGELLLAQLSMEGIPKSTRFVAEELQTLLRGVERNLAFGVDQIERDLRQVQESTEKLRLVRADSVFPILRRVLRDAASELGIEAEFVEGSGGDLRLDSALLASVQGALIQMVRNSAAHGIESREERLKLGKPARASVSLDILREGAELSFCCRDDGRGIDLEGVRKALVRRGEKAEDMSRDVLLEVLLSGGVSTAETVTQAAGRGVGLDVIRQTALTLGGKVAVSTETGQFTEVVLRVPWSIAGMDFLELRVEEGVHEKSGHVLVPLQSVRAVIRLKPEDVSREADGDIVVYDGKGLRLLSLSALLGYPEDAVRTAVILYSDSGSVALSTQSARGTRLANLLPLPPYASAADYVAGAVLNADGNAQLVLDVDTLIREQPRALAESLGKEENFDPILVIDDSLTTRMLQQSILESAGFEVDLASSAEEGLEKARRRAYGFILVDVEMPGIDGFTFIEKIRAEPALAHIPAILVTSRDAPEDKLRGHAVGAQGYMVKSEFDQKYLLQQIRTLMP